MDDETSFAIEQIKLQLASTQQVLQQTAGRALALDAALNATLRSWGKPADQLLAEVRLVLERGAIESAMRGAEQPMLQQYGNVGENLMGALDLAAREANTP